MSKRKYKRGKLIKTVGEYEKSVNKGNRWFMVHFGSPVPKTLHHGFISSWQYTTLKNFIYRGAVYEAKKIEEDKK